MNCRILVVEDSATQAEALRALLDENGYDTYVVPSAEAALERVVGGGFDLVISDVVMPGLTGLELCARIKADAATRHIPVMLLTSLADPMDIVRGLESGADNYLTKPYDREHLLTRLRQVLDNRKLRAGTKASVGVSVRFLGKELVITSEKEQILDLFIASVEEVVRANEALRVRERELAAARQEAERASRAKSEFLSRMSHELRTPLSAILGFGQLLEGDVSRDEDRESVQQILHAGKHLLGLIDEVLDLAKVEAGRLGLSVEAVAVRDVLRESLDLVRPMAMQRGVTVHAATALDAHAHVSADKQRLKQVMLNLLSNAIKYNRDGGSVEVALRVLGDGRRGIVVSDTGPGIPADQLPRLFTPFERLSASGSGVDGTGLGLALSRKLVEAMGGTVGVETEVGQGSRFWIELPAAETPVDRDAPPPEVRGSIDARAAGDRCTVLFIEDNLANVRLIGRVFEHRPQVALLTAMQGRLGIELAREHRPDLVLLDLNLPDLPGDEVLRQLKQDAALAATPVVMISGDAMPAQVERLRALGAAAYLTKPFDLRLLLGTVDDLLQRARQDRAPDARLGT